MKAEVHRWLRVVAWMLGLGFSVVLIAQAARPDSSIANDLQQGPHLGKLSLGRSAAHTPVATSHVPFPTAFRRDPLVGMVALERWGLELQTDHGSAATALHRTGTLGGMLQAPAGDAQALNTWVEPPMAWPAALPPELRDSIGRLLHAIAQAQTWRNKALAQWPGEVSAATLHSRFTRWSEAPAASGQPQPSASTLLGQIDLAALAQGIVELTAEIEDAATSLDKQLRSSQTAPGAWQFDTPGGLVVIDTRPHSQHYRGQQPLLLIDTAGNDHYAFDEERPPGITVLMDLAGHDHYEAAGLGRDPSSTVLGYAVLLDAQGDDRYDGQQLTQGAALFGAAVLIDRQGNDRYQAQGRAQGFALGGWAGLFDFDGHDDYQALTQAQASAGPGAVALLVDHRGNDRYTLGNSPLVLPSAQLKNSNASLGQGTAFGLRRKAGDESPSTPGGLALLLDAGGDDHYEAQVFAQGAGYEGGLGVLLDTGGSDRMQAAWYAMGAAAHHAGGVLVAGGTGKDEYTVSHATSLGAAHDESVAIFVGGLGDDRYSLSTLGLGGAHDASTALFIERGGNDHYSHSHSLCRGFAASVYSSPPSVTSEDVPQPSINIALFLDLGGTDHYPSHCPQPGNTLRWSSTDDHTGGGWGVDVDGAGQPDR